MDKNIYDTEYLKEIMRDWYFNYNLLNNQFSIYKNQTPMLWKTGIVREIYEKFEKFLSTDEMNILSKKKKEYDPNYPFYFLNDNNREMFVWNIDTAQYEPICDNFNDMPDYSFLYINKISPKSNFRFINYNLKSVSYSILKNHYFQFQYKIMENLGIVVIYTLKSTAWGKFSFLGVETYGHMIICPITKDNRIAREKQSFLIEKSFVKKLLS